jgi:zinc-binding in reverse transcriptase
MTSHESHLTFIFLPSVSPTERIRMPFSHLINSPCNRQLLYFRSIHHKITFFTHYARPERFRLTLRPQLNLLHDYCDSFFLRSFFSLWSTSLIFAMSHIDDTLLWRWHHSGLFTTKSAYIWISNRTRSEMFFVTELWKTKIPLRVRIFFWLLSKDRLFTGQNLQKSRGWPHNTRCCLCEANELKTSKYLFVSCPYAIRTCFLNSVSSWDYNEETLRDYKKSYDTVLMDYYKRDFERL